MDGRGMWRVAENLIPGEEHVRMVHCDGNGREMVSEGIGLHFGHDCEDGDGCQVDILIGFRHCSVVVWCVVNRWCDRIVLCCRL